jgi:MOSC domain-containing protein YiiM
MTADAIPLQTRRAPGTTNVTGLVQSVHCSSRHEFSKAQVDEITLLAGIGVAGDAHAGSTVQHRSRMRADPTQPNLRQVHLIADELLVELTAAGYAVRGGHLGENISTTGIDLLALPVGAMLRLGSHALLAVTGLRNPCYQIDTFERGLLRHVVGRNHDGTVVRRAGIMSVVVQGGTVCAGDRIDVALPPLPHTPLDRV